MNDFEKYSLLKEFRCTGTWWLPENPTKQVRGTTFNFSQSEGAILELDGMFDEELLAREICNPIIVNGLSSDGKDITLYRCLGRHWRSAYSKGGTWF